MTNPAPLWAWMRERHAMYQRRAVRRLPPPWTFDLILRTYRFCNVHRETDRVSQWLLQHWYLKYVDHPLVGFSAAVARLINWPPTLEALGFPVAWNATAAATTLRSRIATGEKTYTSAYMLRGPSDGGSKADYTVKILCAVYDQRLLTPAVLQQPHRTLEETARSLQAVDGIGGFLAYEIVCDLAWLPTALAAAPDRNTWAHIGPGAIRGLNRLRGLPVDTPLPQHHALQMARELLEYAPPLREAHRPLELRDIEHSLCEFDKYERARLGEGTPRQRFTPTMDSAS